MQRIFMTFAAVLALTMAMGSANAQDKGKDKGKKDYKKYQSKSSFRPLGKNVTLDFTAKGDGGNLVASVATASNRYEVNVERMDRRRMDIDGVISLPEKGGYLVSYNVHIHRRVKGEDGWSDISFSLKGSALLKSGDERTLGKSGDYTVTMKISDK
jgi:hypothetical protein